MTQKKNDLVPSLKVEKQLCVSLYNASRLMTQTYQPLLEPLGLTYVQYLVMLVLWETDGVSVTEIGERLLLDSGTLSPLLKKLEAKKLIERRDRPDDGRGISIYLTKAGRNLKLKAVQVPQKISCAVTSLTIEQITELKHRLDRLSADLLTVLESS